MTNTIEDLDIPDEIERKFEAKPEAWNEYFLFEWNIQQGYLVHGGHIEIDGLVRKIGQTIHEEAAARIVLLGADGKEVARGPLDEKFARKAVQWLSQEAGSDQDIQAKLAAGQTVCVALSGRERLRVRTDNLSMERRGYITLKSDNPGARRLELEAEIHPLFVDQALKVATTRKIEKTRRLIRVGPLDWEIDRFETQGALKGPFLHAEIELNDEKQVIEIPSWVGKEITADPTCSNGHMAKLAERSAESVREASTTQSSPRSMRV